MFTQNPIGFRVVALRLKLEQFLAALKLVRYVKYHFRKRCASRSKRHEKCAGKIVWGVHSKPTAMVFTTAQKFFGIV